MWLQLVIHRHNKSAKCVLRTPGAADVAQSPWQLHFHLWAPAHACRVGSGWGRNYNVIQKGTHQGTPQSCPRKSIPTPNDPVWMNWSYMPAIQAVGQSQGQPGWKFCKAGQNHLKWVAKMMRNAGEETRRVVRCQTRRLNGCWHHESQCTHHWRKDKVVKRRVLLHLQVPWACQQSMPKKKEWEHTTSHPTKYANHHKCDWD